MLWVLCCFPSATVGCFACSFALVNLVFMEWSRSVSFRLLVVAVSSAHVFSDRAFNFFKVVLTICLEIQCNSPNKYFDLPCPHLYARCFQCQICGHYAWDCKRHFFQLCRYALSVSFNRLFPLRPIFYSTETACSLHAGDRSVPLIFSQSGAWEKGSFAASPADSSVRQYPV